MLPKSLFDDATSAASTQASLLTARAGFDGVFFARADYDDLARRKNAGEAEAVWRGSPAVHGDTADVFMGNFPNHYGPPSGFFFEWGSADPPVQVGTRPRSRAAAARRRGSWLRMQRHLT